MKTGRTGKAIRNGSHSPLAAGSFPQALIEGLRLNGDPVSLTCAPSTANWLSRPHVAVEVRRRHGPNSLLGAIELFRHPRRVKSAG